MVIGHSAKVLNENIALFNFFVGVSSLNPDVGAGESSLTSVEVSPAVADAVPCVSSSLNTS